jgi:hypothetical protein
VGAKEGRGRDVCGRSWEFGLSLESSSLHAHILRTMTSRAVILHAFMHLHNHRGGPADTAYVSGQVFGAPHDEAIGITGDGSAHAVPL